ncbi:MAG TPA: EAL domain-containing protein, partial [Mycobacterium sp.]|nr:EAL domain-containing protein [Mycobacterium sp.]
GFVTVAEGIENAETADWLREHGCHVGQGYYFSRPLPPADLLAFVARHRESRTEIGSSHPR